MNEPTGPPSRFGLTHPTARLGRVSRQMRVLEDLHGKELDMLAAEAEAAGLAELSSRLRTYRDVHLQESALILEELSDITAELEAEAGTVAQSDLAEASPPPAPADTRNDPAAHSPKRARWLAEQAGPARSRPITRRQFFGSPRENG